jgi:hypothetical protein
MYRLLEDEREATAALCERHAVARVLDRTEWESHAA